VRRPLPSWDPALDDVFVCAAVRAITRDVATVLLAPRHPGTVGFEAGQYVTAEFEIDGRPVQRCYTIASPPTRPERLGITVKRSAGGVVSPWLHDGGLRVGTTVRLAPPQGEFTLEKHPASSYLFLTAGVGITPVLSILREAHDLGTDIDAVLVHWQRRGSEVPYRRELDLIAATLPRVRLHFICTDGFGAGRVDADVLPTLVPDLHRREVFVCGPDGYRDAVRAAAIAGGAAGAGIHEETFTFAAAPSPAVASGTTGGYRVEFRTHGVAVDCSAHTTLLDAALSAGVELSFSCTQGLCGTCKSTLVSGEVDMNHAGGIRPREIAAGKILLCCSTPRSDLVITN
jgi:ferredoxin-NADP reductase